MNFLLLKTLFIEERNKNKTTKPLIPNIAFANFYFTHEDYYLQSNSQMHLNRSKFLCVSNYKKINDPIPAFA